MGEEATGATWLGIDVRLTEPEPMTLAETLLFRPVPINQERRRRGNSLLIAQKGRQAKLTASGHQRQRNLDKTGIEWGLTAWDMGSMLDEQPNKCSTALAWNGFLAGPVQSF